MSKPFRTFGPRDTKRIVSHLTKHGLTKGVEALGEKGLKLSVPVAMRVAKENRLVFAKGRPVKGEPRATIKAPRKKRVKSNPAATPPLSHDDEVIMKQEVKENLLASGVNLPVTPVFVPEQATILDRIDSILKNEPLRDDPNQPDILTLSPDPVTAQKEWAALEAA